MREQSWKFVEEHGLSRNDQLPALDEVLVKVSMAELAGRLLCMHASVAAAYGLNTALAMQWLEDEGLASDLVPFERQFLSGDISQQFAVQNEVCSIQALAWSCGLLDDKCLLSPLPQDFVKLLPDLRRNEPSKSFRQRLKFREKIEIVGFLDQTYCLHWALRDAQLGSKKTPLVRWLPAVEAQRHALEWLSTGGDWDKVSLDT
jgi:hypothetical protein